MLWLHVVDQFVAVVGPMRRWQRLRPRSCRDLSAVMTAGVCGVWGARVDGIDACRDIRAAIPAKVDDVVKDTAGIGVTHAWGGASDRRPERGFGCCRRDQASPTRHASLHSFTSSLNP